MTLTEKTKLRQLWNIICFGGKRGGKKKTEGCLNVKQEASEAGAAWHRLQVLIKPEQLRWLKAEGYTRGKSIGEIARELITERMKCN